MICKTVVHFILSTYLSQVVTVQGSRVTDFDLMASNGVIHVIDAVMLPPTGDIVDIVANSSELSSLNSLIGKAGISSALKGDVSYMLKCMCRIC